MTRKCFKKIKGCVIFAAFFMIIACQENDIPAKKVDFEKKTLTEPTILKKENNQTLDDSKEISATTEKKPEDLTPVADVFLTLNPNTRIPTTSFNCDDQIFLSIKFANQKSKLYQIEINWKDPNDQEREKNFFHYFVSKKESFAWASLKLHRSTGAGMLQWINPAAGMEEFIGNWSVDVKVGSLINKTLKFEVLC